MNAEKLAEVRYGAELQNFKPYIDNEITSMQMAIENSVLTAMNNGSLTAEMALTKWIEYLSYRKLGQRFSQKIQQGKTATNPETLDFSPATR